MKIEFNVSMATNFSHSNINSSNVDIYIIQAKDPDADEDSESVNEHEYHNQASLVNLTWEVVEYVGRELEIQLYFDNYVEISPFETHDSIVFHVTKEQVDDHFYSKELKKSLSKRYRTLTSRI